MNYSDEYKNPGRYMAVAGGHKVYLLDPKPEDFEPARSAVSLSHEHRYGGAHGPYSVAQHAVLVAHTAWKLGGNARTQLAALHHDDTEGVMGDTPQPVKALCPDLKVLERRLEEQVEARYGVDVRSDIVREADRIVFCAEVRCLVPEEHQHLYREYGDPQYRTDKQPSWEDMIFWTPDQARKAYLGMHHGLMDAIAEEEELHDAVEAIRRRKECEG